MHSTAIVACERAKLFVAIWIGMLLVASTGSAVSAQDAIGGITGPNYPNPYPQGGTYFSELLDTPRTLGSRNCSNSCSQVKSASPAL